MCVSLKLFQEEARFRSRWVWELLQNARDASPDEGVSVWLIQEPHRVVFRHNGVPFAHKSIAHLIYHGSTKYDLSDSSTIGQFGTGFLTTHLISKTVEVKGRTHDGRQFRFLLDRRGNNHAVLLARLDSGDFVLDNLSGSVKAWHRTGYTFLARQNFDNKRTWKVILAGPRARQFQES